MVQAFINERNRPWPSDRLGPQQESSDPVNLENRQALARSAAARQEQRKKRHGNPNSAENEHENDMELNDVEERSSVDG